MHNGYPGLPSRETLDERNQKILRILSSRGLPILPFERAVLERQLAGVIEEQDERGRELHVVMTQSSETWHDNHAANEIERHSHVISARGNGLVETLASVEELDYPEAGDQATMGSILYMRFAGTDEPSPHILTGRVREIKGPIESFLPEGCTAITIQSPLGQAVLGARPGELVTYDVNGKQRQVEISAVQQLSPID